MKCEIIKSEGYLVTQSHQSCIIMFNQTSVLLQLKLYPVCFQEYRINKLLKGSGFSVELSCG